MKKPAMEKKKNVDYYELLGVSPGAAASRIKSAFIALARRYHPDRRPREAGAGEHFKLITQAYRVLSDPASRYVYDLEMGILPGEAETVPPERRIEEPSVTGDQLLDYVEELTGGIRMPVLEERGENVYGVGGLEEETIRKAFEAGLYSIRALSGLAMHKYYELGVAALKRERYAAAAAYCLESVKLNPRNIQYRFTLGCAYEAGGMFGEAAREYEKTLEIASDRGYSCLPVREALINVCMKKGSYDEARIHCLVILGKGMKSHAADSTLKILRMMDGKPPEGEEGGRTDENPGDGGGGACRKPRS